MPPKKEQNKTEKKLNENKTKTIGQDSKVNFNNTEWNSLLKVVLSVQFHREEEQHNLLVLKLEICIHP